MFIAMRNRKIYYLRFLMFFIPLLGGERAVKTSLWRRVPDRYKRRFAIEAGLNFYATYYGRGLGYGVFPGITQTVKERKYGLATGLQRRLRMFGDILTAAWELETTNLPAAVHTRRTAAVRALLATVGMMAGVVTLLATYVGPANLITAVFAEELVEDPQARLGRLLLAIAGGVTLPVLTIAGRHPRHHQPGVHHCQPHPARRTRTHPTHPPRPRRDGRTCRALAERNHRTSLGS